MSIENLKPKNDGTIIKSIKLKSDRIVWNCQKEVQSAANFTRESWKANKNPPVINKRTLWYWLLSKKYLIFTPKKNENIDNFNLS